MFWRHWGMNGTPFFVICDPSIQLAARRPFQQTWHTRDLAWLKLFLIPLLSFFPRSIYIVRIYVFLICIDIYIYMRTCHFAPVVISCLRLAFCCWSGKYRQDRRWLRPFALMHTVVEGERCEVDSLNRPAEKLKPEDAWMPMEPEKRKNCKKFSLSASFSHYPSLCFQFPTSWPNPWLVPRIGFV